MSENCILAICKIRKVGFNHYNKPNNQKYPSQSIFGIEKDPILLILVNLNMEICNISVYAIFWRKPCDYYWL